jgi:hypothetical protein
MGYELGQGAGGPGLAGATGERGSRLTFGAGRGEGPPRKEGRCGIKRERVDYNKLNARQQENYNCVKLASVLVDYKFTVIRLSDDWKGADLIAVHKDGETDLKIQLKSRLTFQKKYQGKGLWIAFCERVPGAGFDTWFLYDHDTFLREWALKEIEHTESWQKHGGYSWPAVPVWAHERLEHHYKL